MWIHGLLLHDWLIGKECYFMNESHQHISWFVQIIIACWYGVVHEEEAKVYQILCSNPVGLELEHRHKGFLLLLCYNNIRIRDID